MSITIMLSFSSKQIKRIGHTATRIYDGMILDINL